MESGWIPQPRARPSWIVSRLHYVHIAHAKIKYRLQAQLCASWDRCRAFRDYCWRDRNGTDNGYSSIFHREHWYNCHTVPARCRLPRDYFIRSSRDDRHTEKQWTWNQRVGPGAGSGTYLYDTHNGIRRSSISCFCLILLAQCDAMSGRNVYCQQFRSGSTRRGELPKGRVWRQRGITVSGNAEHRHIDGDTASGWTGANPGASSQ